MPTIAPPSVPPVPVVKPFDGEGDWLLVCQAAGDD